MFLYQYFIFTYLHYRRYGRYGFNILSLPDWCFDRYFRPSSHVYSLWTSLIGASLLAFFRSACWSGKRSKPRKTWKRCGELTRITRTSACNSSRRYEVPLRILTMTNFLMRAFVSPSSAQSAHFFLKVLWKITKILLVTDQEVHFSTGERDSLNRAVHDRKIQFFINMSTSLEQKNNLPCRSLDMALKRCTKKCR